MLEETAAFTYVVAQAAAAGCRQIGYSGGWHAHKNQTSLGAVKILIFSLNNLRAEL